MSHSSVYFPLILFQICYGWQDSRSLKRSAAAGWSLTFCSQCPQYHSVHHCPLSNQEILNFLQDSLSCAELMSPPGQSWSHAKHSNIQPDNITSQVIPRTKYYKVVMVGKAIKTPRLQIYAELSWIKSSGRRIKVPYPTLYIEGRQIILTQRLGTPEKFLCRKVCPDWINFQTNQITIN